MAPASRDDCSEPPPDDPHAPLGVRSPTSNGLSATAFLHRRWSRSAPFAPGTAASRYYRRPRVKLRTLAYFEFSGHGSDINPGTRAGARSRTRAETSNEIPLPLALHLALHLTLDHSINIHRRRLASMTPTRLAWLDVPGQ